MADETPNLVLKHLRHMRGSIDRIETRLDHLTRRVGNLEICQIYLQAQMAEFSVRMDHFDTRLTRIEKRLDLAEA